MKKLFIKRLKSDDKGSATIEFAVFASMFFMVMMVALDFGMYLTYQLRLNAAVEQGSMLAFNNRKAFDKQQIENYVAAASRLPGGTVTVDVECNGSSDCTGAIGQCVCLSPDGQSFTAADSCGKECTGGSTSGFYLSIDASYPYSAVVVPNKYLEGTNIRQTAMVRLQ
ncbi:hypothetical protein BSL82_02075 [Tardibacter chloracetimidivorans]|uniref:TadE-like domain-containing protein n=1 Tax=Tardibacter chloracetimidivorans TaxID=1921510 RepID=A0A1L3ZRI3_9SPHN|nr:TadE/TadG family type IV pilus assembly protein [Tardibacter chloracetimidivorans]API58238.1 hypothetical protein BSL82_02075 [Tardibacter chloracetimidivorans]